jgi:perosamine synthetase
LQRLDELVGRKRDQLLFYKTHLRDVEDIELNPEPEGGINGAWITALLFGKSHHITKQEAITRLAELGIPARPFFYPLSSLPAYPDCREQYEPRNPLAYDICSRGINLPGAANLTEDQMFRVCEGIQTILTK